MREIGEVIKDYCKDNDYSFYSDYSGRGMFGRKCVGVVCDNPFEVLVDIVDTLMSEGYDSVRDSLGAVNLDCLGTSKILYFPSVEYEEDSIDDEEGTESYYSNEF